MTDQKATMPETLEEIVDKFYEESEEIHEEAKALETPPMDPDQIKNYHEAEKLGKSDALMSAAQYIEREYLHDYSGSSDK